MLNKNVIKNKKNLNAEDDSINTGDVRMSNKTCIDCGKELGFFKYTPKNE